MKKYLVILFAIFFPGLAYAHQPRIVEGEVINVVNPETSQAFYGELHRNPHFYIIDSSEDFTLYVSVLVPQIEGIEKDVSADINGLLLNGSEHEWESYFEEFGRDYYYQGPEYKEDVKAGIYNIKVFSPDNMGKYVLVIGEKEAFPPGEILNAIFTMPSLKRFFKKSAFTAYFNLTGLFLLIVLVIILVILFFVLKFFRKFKK